jgi:hypothetical protein
MDDMSRRNALRIFGGAVGAAVVGSTVSGLMTPAMASTAPAVAVRLNKQSYAHGEHMRLHVRHHAGRRGHVVIRDSTGLHWHKRSDDGRVQVWVAIAAKHGHAVVRCSIEGPTRAAASDIGTVGYHVERRAAAATPRTLTRIGMSSPANVWTARIGQVGAGVSARRIFADLGKGPDDQIDLVEQAHAAGMMPVVSYKVSGDGAGAAAGNFNAVATKAATRLASYGLPTTVTYWHEPSPDISPVAYVAASKQLLPIFKQGNIKVGPFINGWLLDKNVSTFTAYSPDEMFGLWDWVGIDTYESGTMQSPGAIKPADRIPKLISYMASRGVNLPLGVGEYNGYSAATITAAGSAILVSPQVAFGCMWNSTIGKGYTLTGARLDAFKQTLADPAAA